MAAFGASSPLAVTSVKGRCPPKRSSVGNEAELADVKMSTAEQGHLRQRAELVCALLTGGLSPTRSDLERVFGWDPRWSGARSLAG
jgi:hypothetical protein